MERQEKVSSYIDLLKEELEQHDVEFFRNDDEEKKSGLVNHGPLTFIAAAMLGSHAKEMKTFKETYKMVLNDFNCSLVSPRTLKEEEKLDKNLSISDAIQQCLYDNNYNLALKDYFKSILDKNGIKQTLNEILPLTIKNGCLFAKLYHAILLSTFPFAFEKCISDVGNMDAKNELHYLVASGLALIFTESTNNIQFGELKEFSNDKNEKIEFSYKKFENSIEKVKSSDIWMDLFNDMVNTIQKPLFLFNIMPYVKFGVDDEKKRFHSLFNDELDISPFLIHENRSDIVCALGEYLFHYYSKAQGFVAIHIVSCMCAVVLLAEIIEDDVHFSNLFRSLWRLMSYSIILLETAAERESINGVSRARGAGKIQVDYDDYQNYPDKNWDSLVSTVIDTQCSHSIKLVFAISTILDYIKKHNKLTDSTMDITKFCAFIALSYKIP